METTEKNAVALDGILIGYKANKHADIDSLEIENQGKPLKINFPPHTARTLMDAVHKGDQISVTYEEKKPKHDPKGDKKPKLQLLTLSTSGTEIVIGDIKPRKPSDNPMPENLQLEHFELLKGKKEELFGIRSGKQLIHVHKEDQEFADKIKADSKLKITAIKRTTDGFINQNYDDVYHIQKIVIDGLEYVTKK